VVLVGRGAALPGLADLTSRHFGGAPVRVASPAWEVQRPSLDGADGPGACALCGLAIYGAQAWEEERAARAATWWGRFRNRCARLAALF